MLVKDDFKKKIEDSIANYPTIAPFFNAGDPQILQHLEAMSAMFAMLSAQVEVAMIEPFDKVRDSTVLADAAMRGIIRKAKPARVQLSAKNENLTPYTVETGRALFDSVGNVYISETSVTVAANATGYFEASQISSEIITHTVTGSAPFYAIEIPVAADDSFLSALSVYDADGEYTYRERYTNTLPDERVYHVEADDSQRVYVRFGQKNIKSFFFYTVWSLKNYKLNYFFKLSNGSCA